MQEKNLILINLMFSFEDKVINKRVIRFAMHISGIEKFIYKEFLFYWWIVPWSIKIIEEINKKFFILIFGDISIKI